MKVLLLGTAAGGGFPQWNCGCAVCCAARDNPALATPRLQSSVAVWSQSGKLFLVNVSPDVHIQFERNGVAGSVGLLRRNPIEAALITNADLDHTLGLFLLREGEPLRVICRARVRKALTKGLALESVLSSYCGVQWEDAPFEDRPLLDRDGKSTGLSYRAIPALGGPPRYQPGAASAGQDHSVGYRIQDEATGGSVLILPDVDRWSYAIAEACNVSTLVLFDGTFWCEEELADVRPGARLASQMGHLPVSGPEGSLCKLSACAATNKVLVHINNTNPILLEDSPERAEVERSGVAVGEDGMVWEL